MAEIKVRGLRELDAALRLLPKNIEKRVLGNAIRAAGRVIAADAKTRVPRATGQLKRSIVVRAVRGGAGRAVVGFLKPRSRIAHLIEFGTRFMAARPFLRPALDTKAPDAVRKFGEIAGKGVAREAAKLRSRVR